MNPVVFRTDANAQLGFGHLTRCIALAQALRKQDVPCIMVGPDPNAAKKEHVQLFEKWISVPEWKTAEADSQFLISVAQNNNANWLVLDDYRVDEPYQLALRVAGFHWLQFDGFAEKPLWADFVVNANPAAKAEDYKNVLRNPETKLLLGPKYAVLRQEFFEVKLRELDRPVQQILVTFGGGDDRGAIRFVLEALLPVTPAKIHFVVVSGKNNPNNEQLEKWIPQNGDQRVRLFVDPVEVATLYSASDLAIMAGGTTTHEAARCGLPMILITIADNQVPQAKAWSELGAAIYIGVLADVTKQKLINQLRAVLSDNTLMKEIRNAAMNATGLVNDVAVAKHLIRLVANENAPCQESR
jgi:UDP-2,4-diacetamido-2,4,6-trideoxy-beta-L-altropyranose hydrolase